jgi:2'-5' RNA ligase
MSSVRAFLAVPLAPHVLSSLSRLQAQLSRKINDIRWSHPQNLHLTLHFFGNIDQETLEKIKVSVLSVKRCHQPFKVDIRGLGAFPSLRRPKVIWLGLQPQAQLKQLHQDIQQSLRLAGLTPDSRPYSPHLTIGRVRRAAADLTEQGVTLSDTTIDYLLIDRVVLFESRLQPQGAEHIPLFTVKLDDDI